jgi:hypothetical protein
MMQGNLLDSSGENIEYNPVNKILWIDDDSYYPEKCDIGGIGNCDQCGNELETLSFHKLTSFNAIVAKCTTCDRLLLSLYDFNWGWHNERELTPSKRLPSTKNVVANLSNLSGLLLLEAIPENALKTIFSPREMEAMFARAEGKKYVRQYLYNARKKYSRFADIFDITLDI